MNDETRDNIPDEVSELSVPEKRFDRQSHTHHITGKTPVTFFSVNILSLPGKFSISLLKWVISSNSIYKGRNVAQTTRI